MKKVLITGHRGYIGTHLFDPDAMLGVPMMGCDLKDGGDFAEIRNEYFPVVIHLAAHVMVVESFQHPDDYLRNNVVKLQRFLRANSVGRFIFLSTAAVYGDRHLAREEDASWLNCVSPYAQSKYLGEMIVRDAVQNHVILRLANVYGGDFAIRGEAAVHAHFETDNPIRVFGGDQTRDFIHVDRVVSAIRKAIHAPYGTYNVSSGQEVRIDDLAEEFALIRGVPARYEEARPGEARYVSLDPSKAIAAGLL